MQNPTVIEQKLKHANKCATIAAESGMASFFLSFGVPRIINSMTDFLRISENAGAIKGSSVYIACVIGVLGLVGVITFSEIGAKLDAKSERMKSIMAQRKQNTK